MTLDSFMRQMWTTHGKTEKPYTTQDLVRGLAVTTGDSKFAADFFARFIEGNELPDYAPLLEQAGLKLRLKNAGKASLGRVAWDRDGRSVTLRGSPRIGEPLYVAGVDRGDEILTIGRFTIDAEEDVKKAIERHKPGDEVSLRFLRRGRERTVQLRFMEDDTPEVVRIEDSGGAASESQQAFRLAWLGPDSKDKK